MVKFLPVIIESEVQRVVGLANIIWPNHYTPIIGHAQVEYMLDKFQDVAAITSQIADDYDYYIIRFDGQDAGYFSYSRNKDTLFLSKIYVLSELQGRGLGSSALDFIKEQARSKRIWLTVNKMNSGSIAFYEKNGFVIADEIITDIGGGFVMDDYVLEL